MAVKPEGEHQPGTGRDIDPSQSIGFIFEGQHYTAYAGDTIASALYRAGVRILSRSFKYHRPRGLLCVSGACPNCLVDVDGTPNVRACTQRVAPGMVVSAQNAWPSLAHDAMAIVDKLDHLLPVGFYYKTFIRPRRLWPLYETILRNAAGLGRVDGDPDRSKDIYYDKQYRHADVTVVGGGPAGLAAAKAAVELNRRVTLVEEAPALGGHLRYLGEELPGQIAELLATVHHHPNITVLKEATAFGWYEGNLIGVAQGRHLIKLRTRQLIVATGRIEQPPVFENNDLPGILLGSGLQRLMALYNIVPGHRALVITANDFGWRVARDLLEKGVTVAAIADARPVIPENEVVAQLRAHGVACLNSSTIQKAHGVKAVEGATVVQLDDRGKPRVGSETDISCDLIALSTSFVPNNALLYMSGAKLQYDESLDVAVPIDVPEGLRGAGHAVGTDGLEALLLDGQVAGLEAALALDDDRNAAERKVLDAAHSRLKELKEAQRTKSPVRALHDVRTSGKKRFICLCEDVTVQDLEDAIAEGFDDIQTLKRYSTISMGPCQGKMCSMNAIRCCARETGRNIADTGTTTARPPFSPVKLGVLAGRKMEPQRYSPMHDRHRSLDAQFMNAGQWKRPEHYGDPRAEVRAVREQAGLIDVSTLGKIDVRGPDAVTFLERIYTGLFARMGPGRIRYGLMCNEEGILFDDGVVCRLEEDHFYLSTTSGGADGVYEWLLWWQALWGLRVHITNVTEAYAAINVAGPRAREILAPMTDIDLSNDAFPYMHTQQGELAGIPARWLRIGFVGETGYEIHYPAEYGSQLWDTLIAVGATPFGVEAQRILRLEKQHIIVGQDTDALSDPFAAGMGWAVRLQKETFVGEGPLRRMEEREPTEKLIAFEVPGHTIVPDEGTQIVEGDRIIGRVTSARRSPTLEKIIGLGWVQRERAVTGHRLQIRVNGSRIEAKVVDEPFYDPRGERLRQ